MIRAGTFIKNKEGVVIGYVINDVWMSDPIDVKDWLVRPTPHTPVDKEMMEIVIRMLERATH